MPTYAYECQACGPFETEQRIVDRPLRSCPHCGKSDGFRKLIQPVAVMFKGSGFHINDYSPAAKNQSEPEACTGDSASCGACSPQDS